MYVAAPFKESRTEILYPLIEQYPLGTLITHGAEGLDAMHIPFEIVRQEASADLLRGHIARANPLWKNVADGAEVLVVFQGGDAYISPNWYPSKHEAHRQVPTWNYRAIHLRGQIYFREERSFLRDMLSSLTARQEVSQPTPWQLSDAPEDYIDAMLKAIVGVEIKITQINAAMKLGQNKSFSDLQGAAEGVIHAGNETLGRAMQSHLKPKK